MRTSIGPHPEQTRPRKINDFEPLCQEIWILFLVGNVVWVMLVGNLAEVGENNRFRFLVEPAVFVLAAFETSRRLTRLPR